MAELVGGALLNSFFNVLFDRMATPEFLELLEIGKLDRELFQKLKTYLNTINAVLYDAEYKQIALQDSHVKAFLDDLRDAAYEADDQLDLIAYEVTAAEVRANRPWNLSSLRNKIMKKLNANRHSGGISIPRGVTKKIEEIVKILESSMQQIDPLGLKKSDRKETLPQRELTSPVVEESNIFGRENDKDHILALLEAADENDIGVIPIVGMGGLGKTTLAQLVYNDGKAKVFEVRAWVCVSDNYDSFRIKKELLQQVNTSVKVDKLAPTMIDEELKKSLADKKYLIVLDDIWEIGYPNWDSLREPLISGGLGSKIIVTTRIEGIASMVGTTEPVQLRPLSDKSCWELFAKHAFNNREGEQMEESFKEEILGKCKGLPLAAKMLGGLMRGLKEKGERDAILKSKIWGIDCGVTPVLMLSYQYLPSHLKQCFAYCAIFLKDYKIQKEEIIQLWMAEGFLVKTNKGGENIYELGEKCFKELVSRSFIQEHNDEKEGSYFLMHDLIHDLAQHVSGEFLVRMDEDNIGEFGARNRYFSFKLSNENCSTLLGNICKMHFLRTAWHIPFYKFEEYKNEKEIANEVINKLQCLRVLSLRHFCCREELPHSIKHLKHLRYLNLQRMRFKRLPNIVCSLYNLQTLILCYCGYLVELPKDIGSLINLHFLDIKGTVSLKKIAPRMGKLKELRTLNKFIVGKKKGFGIDELAQLQHLRGSLDVCNLQNVVCTPVDIFKHKKHIESLTLAWSRSEESEDLGSEEEVLEGLQPHTTIKRLSICGYGGKKLPNWIGDCVFSNIIFLELKGFKHCTFLPVFNLPSLKHLSISNCDAVSKVSMTKLLCSLKSLKIENMAKLQEWVFCEGNDAEEFGSLERLELLRIERCPQLKFLPEGMHVLLPSLKSLRIEGCKVLELFPEGSLPTNLQSLQISRCNDKLISGFLQSDLQALDSLSHLNLDGYDGDNLDCSTLPSSLTHLILVGCDNLQSFIIEGSAQDTPTVLLPNLQYLYISSCDELIGGRLQWGLQRFNALKELCLGFYNKHDLCSFPEESLLPSSLTSLQILQFENLEEINYKGLQHLTSLVKLEITQCKKLRCLPKELPSSLSALKINYCPLLKERCERGIGEDWSKISHMSNIEIDYVRI